MITNNDCGENYAGFFSLKWFRVLLAVLLFLLGMADLKTVVASSPYTPGKLAGTYELTTAETVQVKNKDGKLVRVTHDTAMFVSEGENGTVVITSNSSASSAYYDEWRGIIDLNTGKGVGKTKLIYKKTGKLWRNQAIDQEMTFKDLGGGNYALHLSTGAIYKKKGVGIVGPSSSSTTKKEKTQKTDTDKHNIDKEGTPNTNTDESENLPESDTGKAAAAVGTAIGGGLLGLAGGAAGGGGGGTGASGAVEAETPATVPAEPESFVFTDPATGAQSLYERDPETGQWVNPQTGGIVDISDLERFAKQREADAKWTGDQMDKLRNRTTETDRLLRDDQEKLRQKFEEIDRQGAKDKAAIRSGTYGMTDEQRNKYLRDRQDNFVSKQQAAHRTAENWDRAVQVAEGVQLVADVGVDVLSTVTAPVGGKAVADAYAIAKNVASSASKAASKGRSVWGGIGQGVVNGLIDVGQNHAGTKFQKALANVGGEAFKGGLDAGIKGENIVDATCKGVGNGLTKLSIDLAGDAIGKGIENAADNSLKNAFDHAREIRTVYSKGISDKSVKALQKMNIQKHLANVTKTNHQSMANTVTNAVVKNTVPDQLFGDDD